MNKTREEEFVRYHQNRKRDFIERKLSSIDVSGDEQRTNRGSDDLRRGNGV